MSEDMQGPTEQGQYLMDRKQQIENEQPRAVKEDAQQRKERMGLLRRLFHSFGRRNDTGWLKKEVEDRGGTLSPEEDNINLEHELPPVDAIEAEEQNLPPLRPVKYVEPYKPSDLHMTARSKAKEVLHAAVDENDYSKASRVSANLNNLRNPQQ
ncbi:hypothetical protein C5B42_01505 [Candidatus Cerribacteria bacterium 'Amazon FNV 2010 28 9']|uniref:Uncharacterized protein n=1 Tax=Candidatus Cerribacteria bacterium 'Amazon FNV 2010 28 9' TaxID=2081795 RepID=A0A317JS36_9BACT|nr:MAG: hypothetical protein C5B42_01505 [Candidatus Cerribacteria bacterium 'Amazon FNV 2010 28 9']